MAAVVTRRSFGRTLALGVGLFGAPCALIACPATVRAPRVDASRLRLIRERMRRFVDDGVVVGAVTMVGFGGQSLHLDAVGHHDLETKRPLRTDAIFRIASMTKPVTALALMMLAEEGRLSVDDSLETLLPEFRGLRVLRSGGSADVTIGKPARPPTLKDLLTHTAGMAGMPPPALGKLYSKRNRTLAEAVAAFAQTPLEFEPGSKWSYSNTGIDTLGRVIEVVASKPYGALSPSASFGRSV